jgi:uncharacterized protein YdaU (DUF1376 family)
VRTPYFPMYPADFEAKTSHLTLAEDGAYNRLLRLCWMTPGCSIPDDDAWIARRMRVSSADFANVVRPLIAEFFRREKGRVVSPRLREEWEKVSETYAKRSEAGKKGGRPKGVENKQEQGKAGLSRAKAGPKQPEPEPEPIKKEDTGVSSQKTRRRPDVPLPENWVPSDRNVADAESKHLTPERITDEADRFRDYHIARGSRFRDWDAAWRTWVSNACKFAGSRGGNGRESPGDRTLRIIADAARGDTLPGLGWG